MTHVNNIEYPKLMTITFILTIVIASNSEFNYQTQFNDYIQNKSKQEVKKMKATKNIRRHLFETITQENGVGVLRNKAEFIKRKIKNLHKMSQHNLAE